MYNIPTLTIFSSVYYMANLTKSRTRPFNISITLFTLLITPICLLVNSRNFFGAETKLNGCLKNLKHTYNILKLY